jgi:hypothetical protein
MEIIGPENNRVIMLNSVIANSVFLIFIIPLLDGVDLGAVR